MTNQLSSSHTWTLFITRTVVEKGEIYGRKVFAEWEEQTQPQMELNGYVFNLKPGYGVRGKIFALREKSF